MRDELATYGNVLDLGRPVLNPSNLVFTSDNFDPVDPAKRPPGWDELRARRVAAKDKARNVAVGGSPRLRPERERDVLYYNCFIQY